MRHALVISHLNKGDTFFCHRMSTIKQQCLDPTKFRSHMFWSNDIVWIQASTLVKQPNSIHIAKKKKQCLDPTKCFGRTTQFNNVYFGQITIFEAKYFGRATKFGRIYILGKRKCLNLVKYFGRAIQFDLIYFGQKKMFERN